MRVYRKGRNGLPLPVLEGILEYPENSEYNKDVGRNEIVSKFCIKGNNLLFILEPLLKFIEEIKGETVKVHYESSFSGKHANVLVLEFSNGSSYLARKFNGEYEFRN